MADNKTPLNFSHRATMSTSLIDLASLEIPSFVPLSPQHELLSELSKNISNEPMVLKLLEVIVEREDKLRQWINEMARNVLLATAKGDYLDQIVSLYGVKRLAKENDEVLRQRALLSLYGYGASGSKENYLFHIFSLNEDNSIQGVNINSQDPGKVLVTLLPTIMSQDNPLFTPKGMIEKVSPYLKFHAPLTDRVEVKLAEIFSYTIQANLELYPNENAQQIKQEVESRLQDFAKINYALGQSIEASALQSAIYHPGIKSIGLLIKGCFLKEGNKESQEYDMKLQKRIELKFNQAPYCNYQLKPKKTNLDPSQPDHYGIQVSITKHKDNIND